MFLLRDENCTLTPAEKRKLAAANGCFSQILLCSDPVERYSAENRERYAWVQRLFDRAEEIKTEADNGLSIGFRLYGKRYSIRIR